MTMLRMNIDMFSAYKRNTNCHLNTKATRATKLDMIRSLFDAAIENECLLYMFPRQHSSNLSFG